MGETKSLEKILFIRLDKIGDLVCTLPCDEHPLIPKNVETFWILSKGNEFIALNSDPPRSFLSLDKKTPWQSFKALSTFLRQHRFDAVFSFQSPWWVHLALWNSSIPLRFGVLSQWHSFLFLNKGTRQKRSLAEKHEADYNFEIVDSALKKELVTNYKTKLNTEPVINFVDNHRHFPTPTLKLTAPYNDSLFEKFDLIKKEYLVVHPGMFGSALNWRQIQYIEFIEGYLSLPVSTTSHKKVVLTGTTTDEIYLNQIKEHFSHHPQVLILQNKISQSELLTILQNAKALVAPSTGVLHLGASLGTPVYGIYSPILVQHPTRWKARGPLAKIFLPTVDCPATYHCLNEKCPHFNCMDSIKPTEVTENLSRK